MKATLSGGGTWKPMASFVVEFQNRTGQEQPLEWRTAVHYMEADIEANWPGIELEQLCQWIEQQPNISQLRAKVLPKSEVTPTEEMTKEIRDNNGRSANAGNLPSLQIREAHLRQAPDYSTMADMVHPVRDFLGHIRHEYPFTIEVLFQFSEPVESGWLPSPQDFYIQCQVHNLFTGKTPDLWEMTAVPTPEGNTLLKTQLSHVSLEPGMYRLGILVRTKKTLTKKYFDLPKLNVL
jgi:hypothetical protein